MLKSNNKLSECIAGHKVSGDAKPLNAGLLSDKPLVILVSCCLPAREPCVRRPRASWLLSEHTDACRCLCDSAYLLWSNYQPSKYASACVSMRPVFRYGLKMGTCVFKERVNASRILKTCSLHECKWRIDFQSEKTQSFLMIAWLDRTPLHNLCLGPICSLREHSLISESSIKVLAQLTTWLPSIRAIDWLAAACWSGLLSDAPCALSPSIFRLRELDSS